MHTWAGCCKTHFPANDQCAKLQVRQPLCLALPLVPMVRLCSRFRDGGYPMGNSPNDMPQHSNGFGQGSADRIGDCVTNEDSPQPDTFFDDLNPPLPTQTSSWFSPTRGCSATRVGHHNAPSGVPVLPMQRRNSSMSTVPHETTPIPAERPRRRPSNGQTTQPEPFPPPSNATQPSPSTPAELLPEPGSLLARRRSRTHSPAPAMIGHSKRKKKHPGEISQDVDVKGGRGSDSTSGTPCSHA